MSGRIATRAHGLVSASRQARHFSASESAPPHRSRLTSDLLGVLGGATRVAIHMAPAAFRQAAADLDAMQREARGSGPADPVSPFTPAPDHVPSPSGTHLTQTSDFIEVNVTDVLQPAGSTTPGPVTNLPPAAPMHEAHERGVPAGSASRAWEMTKLAVGLAGGSMAQAVRNLVVAPGDRRSALLSDANMDRMVNTVCRMRGAVLKLSQMLSIQDERVLPAPLLAAFARVRDAADIMPVRQLEAQMATSFGPHWRSRFLEFNEKPVASASIGQVHAGTLLDGTKVAVKVQFPGVADSIDSDVDNLTRLFTFNLLPSGLYVENILRELRRELQEECDYSREAAKLRRYKSHLDADPTLGLFSVPALIPDLCSAQVLTMEFISGVPINRLTTLGVPQAARNRVGEALFRLTFSELFRWRYMQTDPNFSNFLYNTQQDKLFLIDFGAAREYTVDFMGKYLRLVDAARRHDKGTVLALSRKIGFLTGEENEFMNEAHCQSVFLLAEPFAADGPCDFHAADIPGRIAQHVGVMLKNRLRPPPTEIYSLHRRLSGLYLGCAQLGAVFPVRPLFESVLRDSRL